MEVLKLLPADIYIPMVSDIRVFAIMTSVSKKSYRWQNKNIVRKFLEREVVMDIFVQIIYPLPMRGVGVRYFSLDTTLTGCNT